MYPRIPWELVTDLLVPAEHILGATAVNLNLYLLPKSYLYPPYHTLTGNGFSYICHTSGKSHRSSLIPTLAQLPYITWFCFVSNALFCFVSNALFCIVLFQMLFCFVSNALYCIVLFQMLCFVSNALFCFVLFQMLCFGLFCFKCFVLYCFVSNVFLFCFKCFVLYCFVSNVLFCFVFF